MKENSNKITVDEKISIYTELKQTESYHEEAYYKALETAGDMKYHYHDFSTEDLNCDREILRLQNADYDICCALLTMLLREDHFCNGSFEERYRKGQVLPILDRIIYLLQCRADGGVTDIEYIKGDITQIKDVSAIVNAANNSLLGGGGVDGAIHRAAGRELLEECRTLHGCDTGKAKITKAYKLPCRYVIHTVGPIWNGGRNGEEDLLANCYCNSLVLAMENKIRSVAFPSISTGVYAFPVERAAKIALNTVKNFVKNNPEAFDRIVWILFDDQTYQTYSEEVMKERKNIL